MAFHAEKAAEGYEFDFVSDIRTTILEEHINGPLGQHLAYIHHVCDRKSRATANVAVIKPGRVLDLLHEGHLGQEKTKTRARDILFWPGMCSQFDEKVSMCSICQESCTSNRKEPMIPYQIVASVQGGHCEIEHDRTQVGFYDMWELFSSDFTTVSQHWEACDQMDVPAWHMGLVIAEVYIKISQHPYQKT
ncbi:hypothetical protein Bbelb_035860 [Branchiostoma belcheri]|nr:hypothetical protein Bbelb_035860 [Branchiostoma belcheri]